MSVFLLLFAGGVSESYLFDRYQNDLQLCLDVFSAVHGCNAEACRVLFGPGGKSFAHQSGDLTALAATRSGLKSQIDEIAQICLPADYFVFIASNHGGQVTTGTKDAKLWCWNSESVTKTELAEWFSEIVSRQKVVVLGQCYSGGFLDAIAGETTGVISACRWDQVSWATSDLRYDEFLMQFCQAIQNGARSLTEAFTRARTEDRRPEEPQISDPGNLLSRTDILFKENV